MTDASSPSAAAPPSRKKRLIETVVVMVITLALDLWSKAWAWENLRDPPVKKEIIKDWFEFEFGFNTGAAFSFLRDASYARMVFIGVTILALIYMARLAWTMPTKFRSAFMAVALVAGGALGNLHDRLVRQLDIRGEMHYGVVDFIKVHYWEGKVWPTFNIADVALVVGVGLLFIFLTRHGDALDAKKADAKKADAKKDDAKKADAKKDDAKAVNPHGAPPPHGAAGPHGGMAKPAMAKKEPGPPREVVLSGEVTASTVTGLTLSVPKEWESSTPSSSMRLAQWVIPGPGGDAELVVFRFPGGGGGVEANIGRWKGQFQPPEGKSIDDVSTVKTLDGEGGLKTTLVDVTGTFVAAVRPGDEEKHNDAEYRMLAAVVEGSGDAYYFKAVGPAKTMGLWAEPFNAMIATFKAAK